MIPLDLVLLRTLYINGMDNTAAVARKAILDPTLLDRPDEAPTEAQTDDRLRELAAVTPHPLVEIAGRSGAVPLWAITIDGRLVVVTEAIRLRDERAARESPGSPQQTGGPGTGQPGQTRPFTPTLYDADTTEPIGPATPEQVEASTMAALKDGGAGIFRIGDRRVYTDSWADDR